MCAALIGGFNLFGVNASPTTLSVARQGLDSSRQSKGGFRYSDLPAAAWASQGA
jgi:hypothetical protein